MATVEKVVSASGVLARFNHAGVLLAPDVHVSQTLGRLCKETDEQVLLAAALTVRALRLGSVCLELPGVRERVVAEMRDPALEASPDPELDPERLDWPEPVAWLEALRTSSLLSQGADAETNSRPLRLVGDLLYLERYWAEESVVRRHLDARAATPPPAVDQARLDEVLDQLFDGRDLAPDEPDLQRESAQRAAHDLTTVVAGGPGTGKTTTVARLLAVLQAVSDEPLRIALAAPSGKASARLEQAVAEAIDTLPEGIRHPVVSSSSTLHKLLDARGAGRGFGRGPNNPLPHQVVVVDEMSMVALPLMARLLEALRPTARLVMVGDHNQLTSVEAGAVLADLVGAATIAEAPARGSVTVLTHTWRFGRQINELAEAIRTQRPDDALALLRGGGDVELVELGAGNLRLDDPVLAPVRHQVLEAGRATFQAARDGDVDGALAALDQHRILCAHREGRWGVARWGWMAEDLLRHTVAGYGEQGGEWYVGRPLLITQNLRDLELSNGDSGVVVATDQGLRAAVGTAGQARLLSPFLLDGVTSLHAMTVHKAQGSQFKRVTVVLPPAESALLTRELLYTAVTRASDGVRLVGEAEAIRKAVSTSATRASGLSRGW